MKEATKPIKNTLRIVLSGVEQSNVSVVLNNNVIGDTVEIYSGFLNSSNSLIADPFLLYFGTIDGVTVTDSSTTSTVGLSVTSHWGAFEKLAVEQLQIILKEDFFHLMKVWSFQLFLFKILNGVNSSG